MNAIILSAGESSRMGTDKATLSMPNGSTLLSDQIARLKRSGAINICVVIGCNADLIRKKHADLKVLWAENNDWNLGSFSSLLCGLKIISGKSGNGSLILPIDAAGIEPEVIKQIADEGEKSNCNIIPEFDGKDGHPVFLSKEFITELIKNSDVNSRLDLLLKIDKNTRRLKVSSSTVLNNINSAKDWDDFIKGKTWN